MPIESPHFFILLRCFASSCMTAAKKAFSSTSIFTNSLGRM
nr:MAG TPA: hypothetical protein [Bacteriophage sp.]DAR41652.1 MAG TPA: hypothetical protein [Caudoviricetes sp.]